MIIALRDSKIDISNAIVSPSVMYSLGVLTKGSGFLLSSGYVVTALHIVRESNRIYGFLPTGKQVELKLAKEERDLDLALLEPQEVWAKGFHLTADVKPKIGDLVLTLGYPLDYKGNEPILSVGFLSNVITGKITTLIVNGSFNVGNSGGPLVNDDGLLLGVVIAKSIRKDPYIEVIEKMMERPRPELVYGSIKFPSGFEEEITLSKAIRTLIRWVADNVQTNIGVAISSYHLKTLTK